MTITAPGAAADSYRPGLSVLSALLVRAGQTWPMEPGRLRALAHLPLSAGKPPRAAAAPKSAPSPDAGPAYAVCGRLALLSLRGVMLTAKPWWADEVGLEVCVTGELTAAVHAATRDPSVAALVLDVDSPGGEASGIDGLADALHAARAVKPVHAVVDSLCASAAYWAASQATDIAAGSLAVTGSIGVYTLHTDVSRLLGNYGVDVELIASGPLKGAGADGGPLTPEQRAERQELVDGMAALFTAAVARGRGRPAEAVRAWATGGVWLSAAARTLGLVDRVETPTAAVERLHDQYNGQ